MLLPSSGQGRQLDRCGDYRFIRPEPQAMWPTRLPDWDADGAFIPGSDQDGGGRWQLEPNVPREGWPLAWEEVRLTALNTPFRHLGFFPDMDPVWRWLRGHIAAHRGEERARALNLFGYTGVGTLAMAAAGAELTHVDASKKSVAAARANAALSGMEALPVRWLVDDCVKFAAREVRRGKRYDAILLDMNFTPAESSGEQGLACLARIIADDPAACVVVITAHSGIRIAVAAMKAGARDFAMKPWRNTELLAKVDAAIARGAPAAPPSLHPGAPPEPARLLGDSPAMHALRDLIRRVGPTPAGVTITGPPGSGRTLTALALHAASAQADTPPPRIDLRDDAAWARLDQGGGTAILRHPDRLDGVAQARLLDRIPAGLRCLAIADGPASLDPALRRSEGHTSELQSRRNLVCRLLLEK